MSEVPPLIPGSKLYQTLKVINGTKITKAVANSLVDLNSWKGIVDAATVSNIAFLSGNKVIDGQSVTQGSIVLVKNQLIGVQNGIYTVNSNSAWTRTFLKLGKNAAGTAVFVKSGLANLNKVYVCTSEIGEDIVGSDILTFESIVLNYNNLSGVNGGIVYYNAGDFGIGSATTDGAGNLQFASAISNTSINGFDEIAEEYLFNTAGKRLYNDAGTIKIENSTEALSLGTELMINAPLISNEYLVGTGLSLSYTTEQISVLNSTLNVNNATMPNGYYSNSYTELYASIQNNSNDINFVFDSTDVCTVNSDSVINRVDVIAPNLLFEGTTPSISSQYNLVNYGVLSSSIYSDTAAFAVIESNLNVSINVYTRSGNSWSLEQSIPFGTFSGFPKLSLFQDTIACGASWYNYVYVYTRIGSVWSLEEILEPNDNVGNSEFGNSVSLYLDTVVIGGYQDNGGQGATWVFVRSLGVWSQQGPKLNGSDEVGVSINQGASVSLYGDTLSTLALYDDAKGAVWIFTRTAGVWTQQGFKLVGTGATNLVNVSLFENTLAIGGQSGLSENSVWIYTRTNDVWTEQSIIQTKGNNVALFNNFLLIGSSPFYYLFQYISEWNQVGRFVSNEIGLGLGIYENYITAGDSICVYDDDVQYTGILFKSSEIDIRLVDTNLVQINETAVVVETDMISMTNEFVLDPLNMSSITSNGNTISFIENNAEVMTVSDTQVSFSSDLLTNNYVCGTKVIQNQSNTINIGTETDTIVNYDQTAKIVGSYVLTSLQGTPSISADGYTIVSAGRKNVWVFEKKVNEWVEVNTFGPFTGISDDSLAISISSLGNVIAIGDPSGTAWIYEKNGNSWANASESIEIIGTGKSSNYGKSVSLNSDGTILAVGDPGQDGEIGAAYVFTQLDESWKDGMTQVILQGTDYLNLSRQGYSVSLNSNGTVLAVGGPTDNINVGAAWIFTRQGSSWGTSNQVKIIGTGSIGLSRQGSSISINEDGTMIASGAPYDDSYVGATWVFMQQGGSWDNVPSQVKLVGTGSVNYQDQGASVSLKNDVLAIGAPSADSGIGAAWIFQFVSNVWTQLIKLSGTGYIDIPRQGKVSLSEDGSVLALGGQNDDSTVGATWVFNADYYVSGLHVTPDYVETDVNVVANGYVFPNASMTFTNDSILFTSDTTESLSLSETSFDTQSPIIVRNYINSNVLGTSKLYNVSSSNNSLAPVNGLYSFNGSVSDSMTSPWIQLNSVDNYLISGRVGTNSPIVFRINNLVITNIQGTYNTYLTLSSNELYFTNDYSSYSFTILVT